MSNMPFNPPPGMVSDDTVFAAHWALAARLLGALLGEQLATERRLGTVAVG